MKSYSALLPDELQIPVLATVAVLEREVDAVSPEEDMLNRLFRDAVPCVEVGSEVVRHGEEVEFGRDVRGDRVNHDISLMAASMTWRVSGISRSP